MEDGDRRRKTEKGLGEGGGGKGRGTKEGGEWKEIISSTNRIIIEILREILVNHFGKLIENLKR